MKIAILTPTKRYGGLGEQILTLANQEPKNQFTWIVGDELWDERHKDVEAATRGAHFDVLHFKPMPRADGYWSNLAGVYNEMLDYAVDLRAHVIISLQDYILLKPDAINVMAQDVLNTRGLVTGLASYTNQPGPDEVTNPTGTISIFGNPYEGWPMDDLYWEDVRKAGYPPDSLTDTNPVEWELNWAGIPGEIVKAGLRFDESYGKGIGYENQDFAWQTVLRFDRGVYVNTYNHALSLPHQLYWPDERKEYVTNSESNRKHHEDKYKSVLRVYSGGRM